MDVDETSEMDQDQDQDEIRYAQCVYEGRAMGGGNTVTSFVPDHLGLMLNLLLAASVTRFFLSAYVISTLSEDPTPNDHLRRLVTWYFLWISLVAGCYYWNQHSAVVTDVHFFYISALCESFSWAGLFTVFFVNCFEAMVGGLYGST